MSLFLCMVRGHVLTSLIYMQLSNFPNTTCWRDCLFSIVYSCLLRWRLIHHRCVGFFLRSLFCSIDPYVCFCANTKCCFDHWRFVVLSEVEKVMPPACFFSFKIALAILGLLQLHINFRIVCFSSVKSGLQSWPCWCPQVLHSPATQWTFNTVSISSISSAGKVGELHINQWS